MATPSPVGVATTADTGTATAATITIPAPSGLVAGNVLIAFIRSSSSAATADFVSSGFTRLGAAFGPSDATARVLGIYAKVITGTEPTSYTFTHAGTAGRVAAVMQQFKDIDTASMVSGFSDRYVALSYTNGKTVNPYAVTIPALELFVAGNEVTSPNPTTPTETPAGYSQLVDHSHNVSGTKTYIWVGTKARTVDSNTEQANIAFASISGQNALAVSLKGTSGEPTPDPDPPSDNEYFDSVENMLDNPGFTWAHRGNSSVYAECSGYAYQQALLKGYRVLEFSMARTSDGVWFGLHDEDINRSAGVAAGTFPNANLMTWAEVSAQPNKGVDGVNRGYLRWEDFKDIAGEDAIIVLDPKYRHADFRTEFLNMCDEIGPDRLIVKFYYTNTGLADAAAARGYHRWGFSYDSDISDPNFTTYNNAWSILGMNINVRTTTGARLAGWNAIKAFNKPVVGHIAGSQADYDTAMTLGASGVQVGATDVVTAVGKTIESSGGNETFDWLRSLGYTGSIQDMQYAFLMDQFQNVAGLSSADLQVRLGKQPREILLRTDWE